MQVAVPRVVDNIVPGGGPPEEGGWVFYEALISSAASPARVAQRTELFSEAPSQTPLLVDYENHRTLSEVYRQPEVTPNSPRAFPQPGGAHLPGGERSEYRVSSEKGNGFRTIKLII